MIVEAGRVQQDTEIDLKALIAGDKRSWDAFCARYAPTINAAVRRAFGTGRPTQDDLLDAGQEVFLKLCREDYKLLREFDPKRAKLSTWIGIISRSPGPRCESREAVSSSRCSSFVSAPASGWLAGRSVSITWPTARRAAIRLFSA